MSHGIRLHVWGEYACWTRPEMKAERVSYDVMTPSGARGILEAIYWKPQMRWVIDRIRVLAPIRFANIRRNEVDLPKISVTAKAMQGSEPGPSIYAEENRQQRATLLLTNVVYGIEAHIEVLDAQEKNGAILSEPVAKHLDQFNRRVRDGACFHRPYLGCREFPAYFAPVDAAGFPPAPEELNGERPLGFMLDDMEHAGHPGITPRPHRCDDRCQPRFFRARMVDGVVDVAACRQETREVFGS
ncbi:MAG: type I-C CRISPR-associated protein Cas5 [Magnetococcales bacterium]|nr:type I-C CRISPR-associated protein Cas5 [Magnetococcales bacterium]